MSSDPTPAASWAPDDLARIAAADDLYVAPYRPPGGPRGGVPGTPTWIWSVGVGGGLYVRAYRGEQSTWYRSAIETRTGQITAGGRVIEVTFEPAGRDALPLVDRAYAEKYAGSVYLPAMIQADVRATTLRLSPAEPARPAG